MKLVNNKLTVINDTLIFKEVSFEVKKYDIESIFQNLYKNSSGEGKTLKETLKKKRYIKFKEICEIDYKDYLELGFIDFLVELKEKNDVFYKNFLNKYGERDFCEFLISDESVHNKKGLYLYTVDDEIKYIGRCRDNFKNRINNGYGHISPKKCFLDGNSTNCHLNNLINNKNKSKKIKFYICELDQDEAIINHEKYLILKSRPEWNMQF